MKTRKGKSLRPSKGLPSRHEFARREMLKGVLGLGTIALLSSCSTSRLSGGAQSAKDLVRRENERTGSLDWLLSKPRVDPQTKYRSPWIERSEERRVGKE